VVDAAAVAPVLTFGSAYITAAAAPAKTQAKDPPIGAAIWSIGRLADAMPNWIIWAGLRSLSSGHPDCMLACA
jgi:hypothetical protein